MGTTNLTMNEDYWDSFTIEEQDIEFLKMQIGMLRQPMVYPIYPECLPWPTNPIRSPFWCENI